MSCPKCQWGECGCDCPCHLVVPHYNTQYGIRKTTTGHIEWPWSGELGDRYAMVDAARRQNNIHGERIYEVVSRQVGLVITTEW